MCRVKNWNNAAFRRFPAVERRLEKFSKQTFIEWPELWDFQPRSNAIIRIYLFRLEQFRVLKNRKLRLHEVDQRTMRNRSDKQTSPPIKRTNKLLEQNYLPQLLATNFRNYKSATSLQWSRRTCISRFCELKFWWSSKFSPNSGSAKFLCVWKFWTRRNSEPRANGSL